MSMMFPDLESPKLIEMIKAGAIGVIRTDTLYGVVAIATNKGSVERVYAAKKRSSDKPVLVLIADQSQLFDPAPEELQPTLDNLWPGPNTVAIPSPSAPEWIRHSNKTQAYRVPDNDRLRRFLQATGPLVAPSANLEGMTPAKSIDEAKGYFGDTVDFYVDGGIVMDVSASNIYSFVAETGDLEQVR